MTSPIPPPNLDFQSEPDPPPLDRLLLLHAGHAYAAAWPALRPPPAPTSNAVPEPASLLPAIPDRFPLALASLPGPGSGVRRLILLRDDGLLALPPPPAPGPDLARLPAAHPLAGAHTLLPPARLWSNPGLQAYLGGHRPSPTGVFSRLVAVLDHFMDFSSCPAGHTLTAELLAVYILATWFLPAFSAFNPLWIIGEGGAGKTRLLHLLARLVHLGLPVPAVGPPAGLFQAAAIGASLVVDDALGLLPAGRGLPRNLRHAILLAGAHRHLYFTLPRPHASRPPPPAALPPFATADLFGPRLFAAPHLPHPGLAARALVIPLQPSYHLARFTRDPASPADWPCDPATLTDDLWALALSHLPELPSCLPAACDWALLAGPRFQTWCPLLAVGAWLTRHGLHDFHRRLSALPTGLHSLPASAAGGDTATLALLTLHRLVSYQLLGRLAFRHRPAPPSPPHISVPQVVADAYGADITAEPDWPEFAESFDQTAADADDVVLDAEQAFAHSEDDILSLLAELTLEPDDFQPGGFAHVEFTFRPAVLADLMAVEARQRDWSTLAARLTPTSVGRVLGQFNLPRHRLASGQTYTITLAALNHLVLAFGLPLLPLPHPIALAEARQRLEAFPHLAYRRDLLLGRL